MKENAQIHVRNKLHGVNLGAIKEYSSWGDKL